MLNLDLGYTRLILEECDSHKLSVRPTAYVLATAYWETNRTVLPVEEAYYLGSKAEAYRKKLRYYPWHGRGFAQLTHEPNYLKAGREIGVDLIANPNAAMEPLNAAKILVKGSLGGWFTGRKLSDYLSPTKADYVNARRIINGTDCAKQIADIAVEYESLLTPEPAYPNIRIGSRGTAVSRAQQLLRGADLNVGSVDGIFGRMTHNAAVKFQKIKRLTQDGIIGPKTWAELLGEK